MLIPTAASDKFLLSKGKLFTYCRELLCAEGSQLFKQLSKIVVDAFVKYCNFGL